MADIIQFNRMCHDSAGTNTKKNFFISADSGPCKSPIMIERLEEFVFSVAFHKSYFNLECLEIALSGLGFGEGWSLYKPRDKQTKMYTVYHVALEGGIPFAFSNDGIKTDDVLTAIAAKITKEVYLEELNLWESTIEISDLVKPYQYMLGDGANISQKTSSALRSAGFDTVQKLMGQTREEVCKIPGMTTDEVYKLEKSMASRGFFLLEKVPKYA